VSKRSHCAFEPFKKVYAVQASVETGGCDFCGDFERLGCYLQASTKRENSDVVDFCGARFALVHRISADRFFGADDFPPDACKTAAAQSHRRRKRPREIKPNCHSFATNWWAAVLIAKLYAKG